MILYNATKKTTLTKDLKEAKSLKDKSLGLLNKKNPRSLMFKTRFGIHTFFLEEPIDVVILNTAMQVVKAQTIRPNSIYIYNPIYSQVLELPQHTINKSKTQVGDKLNLK